MRLASFIVLILVLWLATWKGPHAKSPAPDVLLNSKNVPVMVAPAP